MRALLFFHHSKILLLATAFLAADGSNLRVWAGEQDRYTNLADQDKTDLRYAYRRANENLSSQILYIENKKEYLEDAKGDGSNWENTVKTELRSFCYETESADACHERYVVLTEAATRILKSELKSNKMQVEKLEQSGKGVHVLPGKAQKAKKTYVGRPMSFEQVQKGFKDWTNRMHFITGQQFIDWMAGLKNPPSKEEFVKFKKKSEPLAVSRRGIAALPQDQFVLDRSCNEPICYDEQAYKKAVEDFLTRKDGEFDSRKKRIEFYEREAHERLNRKLAGSLDATVFPAKKESQNVGPLSESAYKDAAEVLESAAKKSPPQGDVFITVDPERIRIP